MGKEEKKAERGLVAETIKEILPYSERRFMSLLLKDEWQLSDLCGPSFDCIHAEFIRVIIMLNVILLQFVLVLISYTFEIYSRTIVLPASSSDINPNILIYQTSIFFSCCYVLDHHTVR